MNALRFSLVALAALALTGMARKSTLSVRFHTEGKVEDGPRSVVPVKLANPPRDAYMSTIPEISERNIVAIYPVQASTGSWGCAFKLDEDGRIKLETLSRDLRGKAMIMLIQTKGGTHQVIDMVIDRPVTDGILYIPHGLTATEIEVMMKQFRLFGPAAVTPAPEKKARRHWWS
jgi:hypothetical protein